MKRPSTKAQLRLSPCHQAGFTIVELLVALVLGVVIIGGVISIFVSNQQAARSNEGLARVQENARVAFELMAREVRQAGGNPCGATTTSNVLSNSLTAWWANWDAGVLQGFGNTEPATGIVVTGTGSGQRVTGTPAIKVLSGGMFNSVTITAHDPAVAKIDLNIPNHGFDTGDIVVVCDAESAALAQVSSVTTALAGSISHKDTAPLNSIEELGFPPGSPKTVAAGGFVTKYTSNLWYVGNNSRGGRSLYRANRVSTEEIAEGIVDMQIDYLLRNVSTGNLGNDWVSASAVGGWTNAAANLVVAVRFKLDLESVTAVGTDQAPLRRQLFHVVNLRNRPYNP
jgi:type IV pilus assembly protein PilW